MLRAEPSTRYIVFPSWARSFTFQWEDLPRLFADPINSGYLDQNDLWYIENGIIPSTVGPFELIDGPLGGGIIAAKYKKGQNWLPGSVLAKEADFEASRSMPTEGCYGYISVCHLQLRGDAGLRFWGEDKKMPKEYTCGTTIEHAEGAGDYVYWFTDCKSGRSKVKGLDEVPEWVAGFDLKVTPLSRMPEELREETSSWFVDPSRQYTWYRVEGGRDGAGYQYALMLYVALHLKMVAGPRLNRMHLVAQIEWKPNFRKNWRENIR